MTTARINKATESLSLTIKSIPLILNHDSAGFDLYTAALEWELWDSYARIYAENNSGIEMRWQNSVTPYPHQIENLRIFVQRRSSVILIADDVGLGKTISAGLILAHLVQHRGIRKTLILCPAAITEQWAEELREKFGIGNCISSKGRELHNALGTNADVIITTYETASRHMGTIQGYPFEILILDEAHKLRNLHRQNPEPPKFAKQVRTLLSTGNIKYSLMLTATPLQNRALDMYALVDLLSLGKGQYNPFGTPKEFQDNYIDPNGHVFKNKRKDIQNIIYSDMIRKRRNDCTGLKFPKRNIQKHLLVPSECEKEIFEVMTAVVTKCRSLTNVSLLQAWLSSPEALLSELENMCERRDSIIESPLPQCSYTSRLSRERNKKEVQKLFKNYESAVTLHEALDKIKRIRLETQKFPVTSKLSALKGILYNKTSPTIVFTGRRATQQAIYNYLRSEHISCCKDELEDIQSFKEGKNLVLVATGRSGAGVNLQRADAIVNYDWPWNPMEVEQRIGRVQRLNSSHDAITVHNLILEKTFEEKIVARLIDKLCIIKQIIGNIDGIIDPEGDNDEKENIPFGKEILKLSVDYICGQNIDKKLEAKENEYDNAAKNYKALVDEWEPLFDSDISIPSPPRISPKRPEGELKTLILKIRKHLHSDGQSTDSTHSMELSDDECLPDSPIYRELLDNLCQKGTSHIENKDLSIDLQSTIGELVHKFTDSFEASYMKHASVQHVREFRGKALVLATSMVADDKCDKLLVVDFNNQIGDLKQERITISNIGIDEKWCQSSIKDQDIDTFDSYYLWRKAEELQRANSDDRKKKIEYDFTPRHLCDIKAVDGYARTSKIIMKVDYRIEADTYFSSSISIYPHENTFEGPAFDTCNITKKWIPVDCIKICAVSGEHALASYFDKCEISDATVLKKNLIKSEISGKKFRKDKAVVSSVSEKCGHEKEFVRSSISNKPMIPEEGIRAQCSTCNDQLYCLPGEAKPCSWDGNRYHPHDLQKDKLTNLEVAKRHLTLGGELKALKFPTDSGEQALPEKIRAGIARKLDAEITSEVLSVNGKVVAIIAIERPNFFSFLFKGRKKIGCVFSLDNIKVLGKIATLGRVP